MDNFNACVAGSPIAHSKSPDLHTAALTALGIPGQYGSVELTEDQLAGHIDAHPELVGMSCTMPLKTTLAQLAHERNWNIDPTVTATRVANTFVNTPTPSVYNTDVAGIVGALRTSATSAAVVGSGATATSALVALKELGTTSVDIYARNQRTRADLAQLAQSLGMDATHAGLENINWDHDVIVSTLPTGVDLDVPTRLSATVLDVAYAHGSVGEKARDAGAEVVSGLAMLVEQAVAQFVHFVGVTGRSLTSEEVHRVTVAMYEAVNLTPPVTPPKGDSWSPSH
ncbi:shikimate dehydrogenase [Brevibacterium sp. UMB1308A]|uniref:shikimate dehydrogenase family protein n=1 Tax=Brevibacterium sp. UMB1308A TaxID=3050608 RepID=UPI0025518B52|nr:shikimate dehydrogenase [Brevibacterium sp. UMB1308A]MDK8345257.1 shikimate dehydrogenase [Brevibacterium sp. UMB1308B]MDK8713882.1 shikimate dehydrogenase [Brevibacterium sp. UMB1308A]